MQKVLHRLSVTHEEPSHPIQFTLPLYNGGITSLCQSMHYRASLAAQIAHTVLCINYISKYCSVWIKSLSPSCFSGRSLSKATPHLSLWHYFRLYRLTKKYAHAFFLQLRNMILRLKWYWYDYFCSVLTYFNHGGTYRTPGSPVQMPVVNAEITVYN